MLNDSDPDKKEQSSNRLDLGISSLVEGKVETREVEVPIGEKRIGQGASGLNLGIGELLDKGGARGEASEPPPRPAGPRNESAPSEERWKCFAPPPSRPPEQPAAPVSEQSSAPREEREEEVVETEDSAYGALVQAGCWEDISRDCERRLAEAGGRRAVEPRLWWIFSQLRLGALPVSILHSRFDKASESLDSGIGGTKLLHLACTVALELADALEDEAKPGEAAALRERAASWNQAALEHGPAVESHSSMAGVDRRSSASQNAQGSACPAGSIAEESDPAPSVTRSPAAPARRRDRKRLGSRRKRVVVPALIGLFVAALSLLWLHYSRLGSSVGPAPYVSLGVEGLSRPEPIPPASEPMKRFSDLTAIYYDVSSSGGQAPPRTEGSAPPVSPEPKAQLSPKPARKLGKEKVDTSSPKETREIRGMERERPEEKAPDIDFPPFVNRAGSSPRGLDARPKPTFSRSRVATVTQRTSVFSLPARTGKVIERLEPGDRVLAIKRHGRWLEIESSDGAGGYVPVEDIAGY